MGYNHCDNQRSRRTRTIRQCIAVNTWGGHTTRKDVSHTSVSRETNSGIRQTCIPLEWKHKPLMVELDWPLTMMVGLDKIATVIISIKSKISQVGVNDLRMQPSDLGLGLGLYRKIFTIDCRPV